METTQASTAEILSDLEAAEKNIVEILNIARRTCEELGKVPHCDKLRIQSLGSEFVSMASTIDQSMRRHALIMNGEEPHEANDYALSTEVRILRAAKNIAGTVVDKSS